MAVSWLKVCNEEVQGPNERELALVDAYAQRNPGKLARFYGLELPPLTRGPCSLSKTFLLSQP